MSYYDEPMGLTPEDYARFLEEDRAQFQQGHKEALIKAMRLCLQNRLVAPQWIVAAFFDATDKWETGEVKDLGEAFGLAWPKGKHLGAKRKQQQKMVDVYFVVLRRSEAGEAIDDELFHDVGKQFGINSTLAKKYYAAARDLLNPSRASKRRKM